MNHHCKFSFAAGDQIAFEKAVGDTASAISKTSSMQETKTWKPSSPDTMIQEDRNSQALKNFFAYLPSDVLYFSEKLTSNRF